MMSWRGGDVGQVAAPPNSPRGLSKADTIISIDDLLRFCDDLMLIYALEDDRAVSDSVPFYGMETLRGSDFIQCELENFQCTPFT